MVELTNIAGMLLAIGAALAAAIEQLAIRLGTDTGEAFDAVYIVMLVNLVLLVPVISIVYYPTYGLSTISLVSFIAAGLLGTLIGRIFYYSSIKTIGASRTTPIVSSSALIATILGVIFLGETLTSIHLIGILFIVGGVAVIAWETSQENPDNLPTRELVIGLLLPIAAAFAFGLEPVFARFGITEGTPSPVGLVIKTVSATIGFTLYLYWRNKLPGITQIISKNNRWFLIAGGLNALFLVMYYLGLELAPVNIVVPLLATNTLFVLVLSAVFMPQRLERVTIRLVIASIVVVIGIGIITVSG